MTIEKTYKELFILNNISKNYISKNPENIKNKLGESILKFSQKQLQPIFDEYNDEVDNFQIKNCLTDPNTNAILYIEGKTRQFSIEGELKLKSDIKEFSNKKVEINSMIIDGIDNIILELTDFEKEVFSGIFICS